MSSLVKHICLVMDSQRHTLYNCMFPMTKRISHFVPTVDILYKILKYGSRGHNLSLILLSKFFFRKVLFFCT